jgi:hypothetical protein
MPAGGTELVLSLGRLDIGNELHLLETDTGAGRKTEVGRVPGAEVHHTEIAQDDLETAKHAHDLVGMAALAKMLELLGIGPALRAWCDLTDFKWTEAQWALGTRHRYGVRLVAARKRRVPQLYHRRRTRRAGGGGLALSSQRRTLSIWARASKVTAVPRLASTGSSNATFPSGATAATAHRQP